MFLQAGCPSCRLTNSVKALKDVCEGTKDSPVNTLSSSSSSSGILL